MPSLCPHPRAPGFSTFQAGVGLNNELAGLLAQEHRVPEGEEALGRLIGDRGVALVQGSSARHVPRGLQHLGQGERAGVWEPRLELRSSARDGVKGWLSHGSPSPGNRTEAFPRSPKHEYSQPLPVWIM